MSKEKFDEIKAELPSIAEIVKQFPEQLQGDVFKLLVNTLLGDSVPVLNDKPDLEPTITNPEVSTNQQTSANNFVEDLRKFFQEKFPAGNISDKEFSVVAAYFYAKRMPDGLKVTEFTEKELGEAFRAANHKPPVSLGGTLRNAKASKYFDQVGTGKYKVSLIGEHFVENDLPKKNSK